MNIIINMDFIVEMICEEIYSFQKCTFKFVSEVHFYLIFFNVTVISDKDAEWQHL